MGFAEAIRRSILAAAIMFAVPVQAQAPAQPTQQVEGPSGAR